MQLSDIPGKFRYPFAVGATGSYIRPIPVTTADPDAASEYLGFPPPTFVPTGSGGVAPDGRDFNGIFNQVTAWNRWQSAGGPVQYDGTFQGLVGGYPKGAIIQSATTFGKLWMSTTENNVTDPDAGGAGWTEWTFGSGLSSAITLINTTGAILGGGAGPTVNLSILQATTSQVGVVKVDGTSIIIAGDGTISATTGGTGSVVSVGLAMPSIFNVSGSPVTTAGTLTAALANQSANLFFAGPTSGGASAPTFRAIGSTDMPAATSSQRGAVQVDNVTTTMSGSVISAVPLSPGTTGLTVTTNTLAGILNIANGGTGLSALGSGIQTWLGTPTSANLAAAITDETGTGALVFANSPTFATKVNMPAGSNAAPSLDFGGTGLYLVAPNTLGISVGGGSPAMSFGPTLLTANSRLFASAGISLPSTPPASASATGVAGTITYDGGFIYMCVATNTWQRVATATW